MKRVLLTMTAMAALQAFAQTPQLVADSYPGTVGSDPTKTTVFNGKLYFAAKDANNGRELWVYDGVNPPSMVYNINPGSASGMAPNYNTKMAVFNNKLYFAGDNGTNGMELMSYDGVNPPTLVADINPGSVGSAPAKFAAIGNKLYFTAMDAVGGTEMFIYDGVNAPVMIDILPGAGGSSPSDYIAYNNKVYFSAGTLTAGQELMVYDPTTNSVSVAYDVEPGSTSSGAIGIVELNNKLYFAANTTTDGYELWSFDGTTAIRVTNIGPGATSALYTYPTVYNNALYFGADPTGLAPQLYKYDPSNGTASLVYNVNTNGSAYVSGLTVYGNKLYFLGDNGTAGLELWMHDGTNTAMVYDLYPGSAGSSISDFAVYNDVLYFNGDNSIVGYELFSLTDPTLSVKSVSFTGNVVVMPNPTTGNATLALSLQAPQTLAVQLTDVTGKLVWHTEANEYPAGSTNMTLPLAAQSAGMYFYTVKDANGAVVASGKLQKQ